MTPDSASSKQIRKGSSGEPSYRKVVKLWLLLRIVTSVIVIVPSVFQGLQIYPELSDQATTPGWPPSPTFGAWLQRIFVEPWMRWDAKFYVWGVSRGFSVQDGSASFHPLLSWLSKPIYLLTGSPLLSILIVSTLATLILYFVFLKLASLDLSKHDAWRATLLFAVYPSSYVLFAPYTESTFLLFSVLTLLFARKQNWLLAGLCGALATLTRQQGLFLAVPLIWEIWLSRRRIFLGLCSLLQIPLAYASWVVYRNLALGDSGPNFSSIHNLIYSVLISPSTQKVVVQQDFLLPPHAFYLALVHFWRHHNVETLFDFALAFIFVMVTVLAWRHMRSSYKAYCLTIILVAFSLHTGMLFSSPYMGLPRHLLLAFPVFIAMPRFLSDATTWRWVRLAFCGFLIMTYLHSINFWVP